MTTDKVLTETASKLATHRKLSDTATAGGVASALVTDKGNVYVGVCIDTACSLGGCAENYAIGNMITNGESCIQSIVAVREGGKIISPCGRCRELMAQINPENLHTRIILKDKAVVLKDLLPEHWLAGS